ncbi:hypothetical protein C8F01DRAFT_1149912 [Mycena amicta]|nr:hypothetical protein C8F01DRAFT_1149912 [Mycena amicta]
MHFAIAALLALESATLAHAGLYFIQPASGSTCTGGFPCTVSWLDDGNSPLLPDIGTVTAGLYTGQLQLVQTLPPVDTADILSYQFTPIPAAGPNSKTYYLAFTSTKLKTNGTNYTGFSPFFTLEGMSGSFSSPLSGATSTIAIASTVTNHPGSIIPTTITVGSVDTSFPTPTHSTTSKPISSSSTSSTSSFTSRFTTSSVSSLSPSVTPAGAAATSSGVTTRISLPGLPLLTILSLCALLVP